MVRSLRFPLRLSISIPCSITASNSPLSLRFVAVFLVLSGPRLDSTVDIPSTKFSQKSTEVTFQIEASKLKASMSLPLWSTNNSFGTERTKDLGTFGILDVTGSYLFFSETDPDHVETLAIDVLVSKLRSSWEGV